MAFGDSTVNLAGATPITSAFKDNIVRADATAGGFDLTLDDAASFGHGVVAFNKVDGVSNLIRIVSAVPGQLPDGQLFLPLGLETDALLMSSDGVGNWTSIGQSLSSLRHGFFVAEHDVTQLVYNVLPSYCGYLLLCDPATAGGWIEIALPPMAQAAFGHQCFAVGVMNFSPGVAPNGPYGVSIVAQPGEPIVDPRAVQFVPGSWKIDLPPNAPQRCLVPWTDKARWTIAGWNGV